MRISPSRSSPRTLSLWSGVWRRPTNLAWVTPADLSDLVVAALADAVAAGELSLEAPSSATIERPKTKEHGDYATNIALQLAKQAKMPPRAVAEIIAGRLAKNDGIEKVDIAGPGFLNITLASAAQGALAQAIVEAGQAYGRSPPRPHAVGGPWRCARPGARGGRCAGQSRVLHQ